MEARISHITLSVADLAASPRFYRDGLDFPLPQGSDDIASFKLKGTWLELFPHEQ
jgi:catechol 2,3-dioxygenase-like lactoylglutathione lyase family enzyme